MMCIACVHVRGQWIVENRERERAFVVLGDAANLYFVVVVVADVAVLCRQA